MLSFANCNKKVNFFFILIKILENYYLVTRLSAVKNFTIP